MKSDFRASIKTAQKALNAARQELAAEILSYPTPISGCDAQFNYLLAERSRVASALRDLDAEFFIPTPRTPVRGNRVES